jgi:arsenite methyltransferase
VTDSTRTFDQVREYYGKILQSGGDLKTNACCSSGPPELETRSVIDLIHPEILERFYGCGSPIPPELEGRTVLDLGCGTGRDSYIVSKLVGPGGRVIGIDMTPEQLEVASRHIDHQMERFGYASPNVEFKQGYIENLAAAGIKDNSIDVVISNCVINLSPDKPAVFSEIFRVLKPGGELYFSDVFAGRRIPQSLRDDPVFYGECLGGALYVEDFRRVLDAAGFADHCVVSNEPLEISNPEVAEKAGLIDFYSMTIRVFKLDELEDVCEDYGQTAVYLGTLPESPHLFVLDDHRIFETNRPMLVCGNTAAMLENTRYAEHFRVTGDRSTHFGPFDGPDAFDMSGDEDEVSGGGCC